MKTKKLLLLFGMLISFIFSCISCENSNTKDPIDDEKTEAPVVQKPLSFDMSSLKGLALATNTSAHRSIARYSETNETLLKITEDGEIQKFLSIPENMSLASIDYITKSPNENSKEIYIVFNGESYWYEEIEKTDENGWTYTESIQHRLGNLICVFEDGNYIDLLQSGESLDEIKFDEQGNMYYLVKDYHSVSSQDMIYKFDPKTKNTTRLVAAISNTSYSEFYVSKKGDWLFVKGERWDNGNYSYYLNAIPVSSPDNAATIWYSGNNGYTDIKWIYNENSRDVYYIVDYKLCRIPYKNGTYNIENVETVAERKIYNFDGYQIAESLLEWVNGTTYKITGRAEGYDIEQDKTRYFYFIDSLTNEINYQEIVNYMFAKLRNYLQTTGEYIESEEHTDGRYWQPINFRNQYEIRFDAFANIDGFEKLATETKENGIPLSDENLFKVIIEKGLLQLLGKAIHSERYSEKNIYNTYNNNFFADILYVKNTNQKIDPELFYKDESGFTHNVGVSWSNETSYSYDYIMGFLSTDSYSGRYWKEDYLLETGTVDAEKVLSKFAELVEQEKIDFSLESFKDDATYSTLYTDKNNEEAIIFLSESTDRLDKLHTVLISSCTDFFQKTCFIPDTNKSAIETTTIDWYYLNDLILSDKALYAIESSANKIVQLTDNDGKAVLEYVNFDYDNPVKFTSTLVHENKFYIKNSILSSAGLETGKHNILCFNPETTTIEEMLWDMPNNSDYEIVSYTINGGNLYCCFVKGTEVIIGEIDLQTRNYNKFATSEAELKQIMIVR